MSNTIMGWEVKQVKSLINYISLNSKNSTISSISAWASKNNKKAYSVRNFFYKLKKQAKSDELFSSKLVKLGVNLDGVLANTHQVETLNLLENVLNYSSKLSVNAVCLKLAGNDEALAQKFQNRYRNTLANNPELVEQVLNKLHSNGIPTRITYAKFPKVVPIRTIAAEGLSDADLKSLILGVIGLIKKDSEKKAEQAYLQNTQRISNNLQKVLIDSRKKDVMLAELKAQNQQIKKALKRTKEKQKELQEKQNLNYLTIQSLLQSNKQQALQSFIQTLIPQTQQNST